MLGIILLILKIIGIVLLAIIGLLLLILLAILFVPVRYKAWGEKHEKLKAQGRVTWLFHILRIKVSFEDGKLKTKGKLLFFNLIRSEEDVEKEWNDVEDDDSDFGIGDEEALEDLKKAETKQDSKPEAETEKRNVEESAREENKTVQESAEEDKITAEASPEKEEKPAASASNKKNEKKGSKKKKRKDKKERPEEPKEHKQGIVKKVKNLYNIKDDPRAKRFYAVAKARLKKIIRHILPRKLKGSVKFGTGDPCTTGKILGAAAMMYPIYGDNISVEPHFEDKMLEFDIYLRGRIRLFTVGLPLLMTYKNKDLKYLRKKIKKALK
ncbi:MAG: DUF2953 domain-containing protein [Lachnospiraceae bacterium]|nr:DUF2953 domain-containing protein [Lachnospiraceae bacterium]